MKILKFIGLSYLSIGIYTLSRIDNIRKINETRKIEMNISA